MITKFKKWLATRREVARVKLFNQGFDKAAGAIVRGELHPLSIWRFVDGCSDCCDLDFISGAVAAAVALNEYKRR